MVRIRGDRKERVVHPQGRAYRETEYILGLFYTYSFGALNLSKLPLGFTQHLWANLLATEARQESLGTQM